MCAEIFLNLDFDYLIDYFHCHISFMLLYTVCVQIKTSKIMLVNSALLQNSTVYNKCISALLMLGWRSTVGVKHRRGD